MPTSVFNAKSQPAIRNLSHYTGDKNQSRITLNELKTGNTENSLKPCDCQNTDWLIKLYRETQPDAEDIGI
jgi:hypothetical protein